MSYSLLINEGRFPSDYVVDINYASEMPGSYMLEYL